MSSITVFLPTLGRPGLRGTIRSFFEQELHLDDRLVVLGSGWEEPWITNLDHQNFEFRKCPRSTCKGHENLMVALEGLKTDYWFYIGDDDVFMPGAFERTRPLLDSERVFVGEFFGPDGTRSFYFLNEEFREAIQFCQVFFPKGLELPDMTKMNDVRIMDWVIETHGVEYMKGNMVVMPKYHQCSNDLWPWEWSRET